MIRPLSLFDRQQEEESWLRSVLQLPVAYVPAGLPAEDRMTLFPTRQT